MPMPLFPYAQGEFFRVVNDLFEKAGTKQYEKVLNLFKSEELWAIVRNFQQGDYSELPPGKFSKEQRDHCLAHWLTPGGQSATFPHKTGEEMEEVLREGFETAISIAKENDLPLNAVWVCNASHKTLEAVTVLNEGVNVMLMLVTPPPVTSQHPGKADNVWITKKYHSKHEIDAEEERLGSMGDPDPKVLRKYGGNTQVKKNEVGTLRVWT